MEAPKPLTPSQMKEFPLLIGKDNFKLSIIYSPNSL